MSDKVNVKIEGKQKSYPIYIDTDPIDEIKDRIMQSIDFQNFLVVMSEKVYKLYSAALGFDKNDIFILKDGEIEKNFQNYQKIIKRCEEKKLNRKSALIAVGGGVVGDITGFAAATYMRGIKFIQVPTTLLACVDSSVGGKVAIDTKFGKNLVGAFYQPDAVFENLNFLKTLDERQLKSGLAEVIKYAFIEKSCNATFDYGLFDFLSIHYQKVLDLNLRFLSKIIRVCIELKISVVSKDEQEANLRKILNFGHTYAHALETITNYKQFTHGEAVAYGMFFIFNYAHYLKIIDANYKEAATDLLKKFGFEDKKFKFDKKKIFQIMHSDKKAENFDIKVILPLMKGYVKEGTLDKNAVLNAGLL